MTLPLRLREALVVYTNGATFPLVVLLSLLSIIATDLIIIVTNPIQAAYDVNCRRIAYYLIRLWSLVIS